jgi:large subunit ribosomal protein L31
MKANIHPDYHEITVVHTDGTRHQLRTTAGKAGDVMTLDIDPLNHPAWTGGSAKVMEKGRLAKFSNKYAGIGVASSDKVEGVKKPEAKKEDKETK